MSGRVFVLLLVLAALTTALTYTYTSKTSEIIADPGLRDLELRAKLHGWPWGYYAEVTELVRWDERRVAVMEYNELRFEMLGRTYMVWLVAWLVGMVVFIVVID